MEDPEGQQAAAWANGGSPGKDMLEYIKRNTPPVAQPVTPRTMVAGRNEPCPCGSGKKFKKFHLGRTNDGDV